MSPYMASAPSEPTAATARSSLRYAPVLSGAMERVLKSRYDWLRTRKSEKAKKMPAPVRWTSI
jgi:hypothetical protein